MIIRLQEIRLSLDSHGSYGDFYNIIPYYIVFTNTNTVNIESENYQSIWIEKRKKADVFKEVFDYVKYKRITYIYTNYGSYIAGYGMLLVQDSYTYKFMFSFVKLLYDKPKFIYSCTPNYRYNERNERKINVKVETHFIRGVPSEYAQRFLPKEAKGMMKYINENIDELVQIPDILSRNDF